MTASDEMLARVVAICRDAITVVENLEESWEMECSGIAGHQAPAVSEGQRLTDALAAALESR